MLRFFIFVLFVLNIGLWGWHQGWLGEAPDLVGREPARLAKQKYSEAVQVTKYVEPSLNVTLSHQVDEPQNNNNIPIEENQTQQGSSELLTQTDDQSSQSSDVLPLHESSAPTSCVESGPLNSGLVTQFQQGIPDILPNKDMWRLDVKHEVSSWSVYVGVFASEEEARKRKSELANMGLVTEMVRNRPQYEPGLSFDMFRAHDNAKRRLEQVRSKGIEDARIIPWNESPVGQLLVVPSATAKQHEELNALAKEIGAPAFKPCKTP